MYTLGSSENSGDLSACIYWISGKLGSLYRFKAYSIFIAIIMPGLQINHWNGQNKSACLSSETAVKLAQMVSKEDVWGIQGRFCNCIWNSDAKIILKQKIP